MDARYLYALKQSGSIYQPVYLGPRTDIPAADCTVDQLKFKPEPATTPQQPQPDPKPSGKDLRGKPVRTTRQAQDGETRTAMKHPPSFMVVHSFPIISSHQIRPLDFRGRFLNF